MKSYISVLTADDVKDLDKIEHGIVITLSAALFVNNTVCMSVTPALITCLLLENNLDLIDFDYFYSS